MDAIFKYFLLLFLWAGAALVFFHSSLNSFFVIHYQSFIEALLLTSIFHEGLSFMAIGHNPACISILAPCSLGFTWATVNLPCGVLEQWSWKL